MGFPRVVSLYLIHSLGNLISGNSHQPTLLMNNDKLIAMKKNLFLLIFQKTGYT